MNIPPEQRQFRSALALIEGQAVGAGKPYRYLEGRAVPYDTLADVGWFLEQHASGSFKQSTKAGTGRGLPLLLFHENRSFPIGHAEEWRHDDGLSGVWRLNDSPEAQRAAGAVDDGDLNGLSIGFLPIKSEWAYVDEWAPDLGPEHKDRVTRFESRLLEVSLTPTPAFEDAEVACVRTGFNLATRAAMTSARPLAVDAWRDVLDELRSAKN